MHPANRLTHIGEYYFSQKLREIDALDRAGKAVINLGIGSPDLPPHPEVIRALHEASARPDNHAYQSYRGAPALRRAMAHWYAASYGVALDPEAEILPLIGSKEGILHLCMTYVDPGNLVLVPNPGYPAYASAARLAGGVVAEYTLRAENAWLPDFDELERLLGRMAGGRTLMFVNYPHMPTGQLPTRALFAELVDFAHRRGVLLCHDNPYSFLLNDQPQSLLAVEGAKEVAVELNSLSKSHNLAGWRVGALCGAANRITDVLRFKSNMDSGMFLPVQLAAAAALGLPRAWYDDLNAVYRARRYHAFRLLDLLGCTYSRDQAGLFVWAQIPDEYADGYALSDALLHGAGVFVTPGGIFGSAGQRFVRISLCIAETGLKEAIEKIGLCSLAAGLRPASPLGAKDNGKPYAAPAKDQRPTC